MAIVMETFFLALIMSTTLATYCHQYRKDNGPATWNCSYIGFLEMNDVDHLPEHFQVWDISHNNIEKVEKIITKCGDSSTDCTGCLKRLMLNNNEIETIITDAFETLSCLEELDLSSNKLTSKTLGAQTFQGLHKLRTLRLSNNPLTVLPNFVILFEELLFLQELDLSYCQLTNLEPLSLSGLTAIRDLDLSQNLLTNLSTDVFLGLGTLEVLNLTDNLLTKLDDETFASLHALWMLDLSQNRLADLPEMAFDGLRDLVSLSLKANRFETLPFKGLRPLKSLVELDFSGNPIKKLEGSLFPQIDTIHVTSLVINDCPLTEVESDAFNVFPRLKRLRMTGNRQLSYIHPSALSVANASLQEVYLDDNSLSSLPKELLPWDKVRVVSLENNPWHCDCLLKWILETSSFNHTLRCRSPSNVQERVLLELRPADLTCYRSLRLFWALAGLLTVITLIPIVFIVLRSNKDWSCSLANCWKQTRGRYIFVYNKDVDDDQEAIMTIQMTEEEVKLTADVDENHVD